MQKEILTTDSSMRDLIDDKDGEFDEEIKKKYLQKLQIDEKNYINIA